MANKHFQPTAASALRLLAVPSSLRSSAAAEVHRSAYQDNSVVTMFNRSTLLAVPRFAATALLFVCPMELGAKDPCIPHDDVSQFICRYGKPDVDDSTENDRPRPPIVTRMLTYKKEGVRAAYVPDAKMGEPPPYKKWKLIGFQDPKTDAVLSAQEVVRRMQARDTRK